MKNQTNSIEDFFSVWDSQKDCFEETKIDVGPIQIHRPAKKHYMNLLLQETVLATLGIALLALYLTQWYSIFESSSAPKGAYIVTLFIWIIGIIDSFSMIIRVSRIHLLKDTIFEVAKKSATLALVEKVELFLALLGVIPLTLFFLVPTTIWIFSGINLYTDWSIYKEIYTIPLVSATIIDVAVCIYLFFKNTRYIKKMFSEWKYYKQLK